MPPSLTAVTPLRPHKRDHVHRLDRKEELVLLNRNLVLAPSQMSKSRVGIGFPCSLTDPDNPSELIFNLKYFYILKTQIYPFEVLMSLSRACVGTGETTGW